MCVDREVIQGQFPRVRIEGIRKVVWNLRKRCRMGEFTNSKRNKGTYMFKAIKIAFLTISSPLDLGSS